MEFIAEYVNKFFDFFDISPAGTIIVSMLLIALVFLYRLSTKQHKLQLETVGELKEFKKKYDKQCIFMGERLAKVELVEDSVKKIDEDLKFITQNLIKKALKEAE
jgi:hypothetical protein